MTTLDTSQLAIVYPRTPPPLYTVPEVIDWTEREPGR
jgi:hypothetical protein